MHPPLHVPLHQMDMEDIGGAVQRKGRKGAQPSPSTSEGAAAGGPPEMLTPLVRGSLTKQVGEIQTLQGMWVVVHKSLQGV